MFSELSVGYADVHPDGLRWALDLAPLDALASLPVAYGEASIELRILGTSHQVIVSGKHGMHFSETVACGLNGEPLPGKVSRELIGVDYGLVSTVEQLSASALERRVRELVAGLRDRPDALVGAFPGERTAVTALEVTAPSDQTAKGDRLGWSSWHCYPGSGHLVETRASLQITEVLHSAGAIV